MQCCPIPILDLSKVDNFLFLALGLSFKVLRILFKCHIRDAGSGLNDCIECLSAGDGIASVLCFHLLTH